jgi:hypothetical protein
MVDSVFIRFEVFFFDADFADYSLLWFGAAALKALIVAVIPAKAGTQTGQS